MASPRRNGIPDPAHCDVVGPYKFDPHLVRGAPIRSQGRRRVERISALVTSNHSGPLDHVHVPAVDALKQQDRWILATHLAGWAQQLRRAGFSVAPIVGSPIAISLNSASFREGFSTQCLIVRGRAGGSADTADILI